MSLCFRPNMGGNEDKPATGNLTLLFTLLLNMSASERHKLLAKYGFSDSDIEQILGKHIQNDELEISEYLSFRIHKNMLLYLPPLILLLGTLGNVLSFVILRHRAMNLVSTYFYLAILAIADILVLYIGLLRLWIGELTDVDVSDKSDWMCKLTMVFAYVTSDLSVWLIIAVTVERYIAVCYPFQASSMCTVVRAKWVIVILMLLLFSINSHFFWTVEITYINSSNKVGAKCDGGESYQLLVNEIWPWVDTILYSFLPFLIIIFLNSLIIRQVVMARRSRGVLQSSDKKSSDGRRPVSEGSTKITVMLLAVSCSFLVTTLPMNIFVISTSFWNSQRRNNEQWATYRLLKTVTELLMYVNHSMNFFLYCATGQKFRQQLLRLFCKRQAFASSAEFSHYSTKATKCGNDIRTPKNGVTDEDDPRQSLKSEM